MGMHYHLNDEYHFFFLNPQCHNIPQCSRLFKNVFLTNANVLNLTKFSFTFYQVNIANRPNAPPKYGRVWIYKTWQKTAFLWYSSSGEHNAWEECNLPKLPERVLVEDGLILHLQWTQNFQIWGFWQPCIELSLSLLSLLSTFFERPVLCLKKKKTNYSEDSVDYHNMVRFVLFPSEKDPQFLDKTLLFTRQFLWPRHTSLIAVWKAKEMKASIQCAWKHTPAHLLVFCRQNRGHRDMVMK